jgi:fructose-1-phosphate kinase PfkB-like protein
MIPGRKAEPKTWRVLPMSVNLKDVLSRNFGIKTLTELSLKKCISYQNTRMTDAEKRRINREIAHAVIKTAGTSGAYKDRKCAESPGSPGLAGVLAVNHAGPLDITIEWKTGDDGTLTAAACHVDSGGDQINVSKVFSNFSENIALVALAGKAGGELANEWENNFLSGRIISELIRSEREDQQVAVCNIVDGTALDGTYGWAEELSKETVEKIGRKTLEMLEMMFKGGKRNVWMVFSAGGPLKYNRDLAYYSSLAEQVKRKYGDRVKMMIDFKFMSGPEEAMSVLNIPREKPQDIIKPNMEEFMQILEASGISGTLPGHEDMTAEKAVRKYAMELRKKYNLLGVLVSMDKNGLMLVLKDRIIREKGVSIIPACHTAAGDSLKAGFLYALSRGKTFEQAVHTGNLFGASTASMEGSKTVTPEKLSETEALAHEQNVRPEVEHM